MGASQSIPSVLTREKVFELTRSTRNVMDILLEYMLKEVTVRDFLALSNPTECKKYVIFMANDLYKHFYELQIVPTKDKKGVIAFRTVKDLTTPTKEDDSHRQTLCLTLAYFYTRIFQIYGALALTLIDDSKYMVDSGIIPQYGDTTRKGLLPPGFRSYTTTGGAPIPATALGNFNFLRSYLSEGRESAKGFITHYTGEGESRGEVYFLPSFKDRDENDRPISANEISETRIQKGTFSIGYSGARRYAYLDIFSRREGIGGAYKIQFGKLRYIKKEETDTQSIELSSDILPNKLIMIDPTRPDPTSVYVYKIRGFTGTVSEYFNTIFKKLVPYVRSIVEGSSKYTTGYQSPSEAGTSDELKLGRIIHHLTVTKPLGHCLARALQLLKTLPLKGEPGVSFICKAKFFEQTTSSATESKTTITRSGIPEPGSSLESSPGMSALSQLFYDTILVGTPKIAIGQKQGPSGQPSSLQQYISFMKNMAKLFGDDETESGPRTAESLEPGLKSIKNRRDKDLCGSTTGNIIVPPSITGNVYDIVNQLYKTQVEHSAKCGAIFKLLFGIQQDKATGRYRLSLSDNIIKKGFPEIERINYLARDVLMKYYTTCELKYLQGMKIIIDTKHKMNAAAVTAATGSTAAPAATGSR